MAIPGPLCRLGRVPDSGLDSSRVVCSVSGLGLGSDSSLDSDPGCGSSLGLDSGLDSGLDPGLDSDPGANARIWSKQFVILSSALSLSSSVVASVIACQCVSNCITLASPSAIELVVSNDGTSLAASSSLWNLTLTPTLVPLFAAADVDALSV